MKFIGDFHLHSKYSRATSKHMDLENFDKWAKIKGIQVLGTGDFTHPEWFRELKEKLEPAEKGLFRLKKLQSEVRFILTSEISCIYSKNEKVRKIHIIIFAPNFETVLKINTRLSGIGNLKADGRPILGLDAKELAKIVLDASSDCLVVPAHAWTPWFGIFGSKSGFDSMEECFEEMTKYIYSIETGLSSDPPMNWRLSSLDNITLISNSDAHSPRKIGREANIFEGENLNYKAIIEAIKQGSKTNIQNPTSNIKLVSTIEFFPEEGKYHFDGHRKCDVRLSPEERKKYGGICPNCGKPLTIGVMSRVDELADKKEGEKPSNFIPFVSLVPLPEIIQKVFLAGSTETIKVQEEYQKLISIFGSEFKILLDTEIGDIAKISPEVAEGIRNVRERKIKVIPGYDGEFGKVQIFGAKEEREKRRQQKTLF